jgi:hypothetical protein
VLGLAAAGETRASGRLATGPAETEITDQCSNLVKAEDWLCCVVGSQQGCVIWSGSTASIAVLQATQTSSWFMRRCQP